MLCAKSVSKTPFFLHQYLFEIIHDILEHGVSLYGYGKNGKEFADFFSRISVTVHHIYDQASDLRNIKSGGVLSPKCIPTSDDHTAVCIVTPAKGLDDILPLVEPYYARIISADEMRWLIHMLPQHFEEQDISYQEARPFDFYESPFITPVEMTYERQAADRQRMPAKEISWNLDVQHDYCQYLADRMPDFQADVASYHRYQEDNISYGRLDAAVYYGMLRRHQPRRIMEIGSGFTTRLAMDTSDAHFDGGIEITCIEPYPNLLLEGIAHQPYQNLTLERTFVQSVDPAIFGKLEADDILFIDSSHVIRAGGDVPFEIFDILPRLASGVLIHVHDIFYPFTYPQEWLQQARPYGEAYALRAFLSHNDAYEILFFTHMMTQDDAPEARRLCALAGTNGGSLWLRKK
ncbi:MAG: class I SAM-dependent methyltransferase [Selenomonas bovis]|nr:class I SAM-dependent methyltransferase [Selenomonas bovis]